MSLKKKSINARKMERAFCQIREVAAVDEEKLTAFCKENGIKRSKRGNSFYFTIEGKNYRVSDHSADFSNRCRFASNGKKIRGKYHSDFSNEIWVFGTPKDLERIYTQKRKENGQ